MKSTFDAPIDPPTGLVATLRDYALTFPETFEDFPWGDRVVKVKKKIFVFLGRGEDGLSISVKLPHTGDDALSMPFVKPTGYGLGKSGWVSGSFGPRDAPALSTLRAWIDESYRSVAPATLLKKLDAAVLDDPPPVPKKKVATKRATTPTGKR